MAGYLVDQPGSALRRPYIVDQPVAQDTGWTEAEAMPGSELGRGFKAGLHGSLANIQAFGAAMADSMGFRDAATKLKESALRRAQIAGAAAPFVNQTEQVEDISTALQYGAGAVGQAAGSLLPTGAAALLGGAPGAYASLVPMSGGEVAMRHYQNDTGATPQEVLGASVAQGAVQGALGMAPLASIVGKGPLARLATAGAASPGARFATRMGATMVGEGAQEGFEEYTAQQAMRALRGEEMGPADDPRAIRESAIAGAVGMAPFGAVHGAVGGTQDAGGFGLRKAAEARRAAEEQARGLAGSPVGQAVKEVGQHISGIAEEEMGKRSDDLAGMAAGAEGTVRRIYDDMPAMGARLKEGVQEQGYADRFSEVKEHAEKLAQIAGKGFTSEELGTKPVMEAHGKDVADMAARLRERTDLTPEDQDALDLFDKERGAEAPGRAAAKHVRQPVAKAFLRAMERDRTAEIGQRMQLIGKKFAGTKSSLSPTGESTIDRLLIEAGFAPLPSPGTTVEQDLSRQRALKAEAARPKSLSEQYRTRRGEPVPKETEATPIGPRAATVRASSVADRAIWAMFDADYREPNTVDRLSGHVNDLVRRIAHGEAAQDESTQAERALVSMASTPQAANQLRELFAKARELSVLDLNKKDQRRAFIKELSELITSKRLPYTDALAEFAKEAGNDPREVLQFVQRFEKLMIRDDTRQRAEAEVQRMFGAENFSKALRILHSLIGPPESFAPVGANREAHNRPGLDVDERAPHLRDQEPDPNDPEAMASYLGYEGREEEPETRGFGIVGPEEVADRGFVLTEGVTPLSRFGSFRNPVASKDEFFDELGKDTAGGRLRTMDVMDAVNEAAIDAAISGEEFDRASTLQRLYERTRGNEEQDAAAARDFLAARGEFTGQLLRGVDPDTVIPKIRKAMLSEIATENKDVPDGRTDVQKLSRVKEDRFQKEIAKYSKGDPDIARALTSIYWNEVGKEFGDRYGPAEFFSTFKRRVPGKRSQTAHRTLQIEKLLRDNLKQAEGAKLSNGQIELEYFEPGDDSTKESWVPAALDLPTYLAKRVRSDDKVVSRANLQGALTSLVLHLDKSPKFRLTDKSKKALGLVDGRLNRALLLFDDGNTQIRGKDFSGLPMEAPESTPFHERFTEKDLQSTKGAPHPERGDLQLENGQKINLPQAVTQAAQMHGADSRNIQRLNIAQIASLLDRVFSSLEKAFPTTFDRAQISEDLLLARRRRFDGQTQELRMADFKPYGLELTSAARLNDGERKFSAMEYSMEASKTSELNLEGYLGVLQERLGKARKDLQKSPEERAKERYGDSERSELDNQIRAATEEIHGIEQMLRRRVLKPADRDEVVKMIDKKKRALAEMTARRVETLAKDLNVDETRARVAAEEANKEYENRDVGSGDTADDVSTAEFFERKWSEAALDENPKDEAAKLAEEGDNYPSKNVSDIVGTIRSMSELLDKIRWGKPFDTQKDIPAQPVTRYSTVIGGPEWDRHVAMKDVTISEAPDVAHPFSRLVDEEPPNVVHDPKHVPKAKPLPKELYAEYEARKAAAPEAKPDVAAQLEDNLEKLRAMLVGKSLSPKQIAARVKTMNVDVSVLDAFMRELPETNFGRTLKSLLNDVVGEKLDDDTMFSRSATDERGSQDDFGNDYKKAQFDEGLLDHIHRFGEKDKADAKYRELRGKSGSYNPTTGELIVNSIATSVGQAWSHENIHHLFKKMRDAGGEAGKVIQTLIAASDKNEAVLKKARELLVKDLSEEDAKALLADFDGNPEERAAYLYQLRVAGLIGPINPPAEGAIRRIFRWLHDKLGFLSDEQKAENFLKAWEAGQLKGEYKNPSALARAMGQESRLAKGYEVVTNGLKPIAKAVANAFTPSYDRVMEIGKQNPAIKKIAEMFGRRTPGEDGRQGYYWEREKLRIGLENRISAATEGVEPKDLTPAIEELLTGEPKSELATKLKALIGDKIPDVTDREEVSSRFTEWLADVKIEGPKSPGAVQRALSGDKIDEYFGGQGQLPNFSYLEPEKRIKWQVKDPMEWLSGAIRQIAAKQAREQVLGKDAEKLKALLQEAREKHYATDDDMSVVKKFIAGTEGWLGADMPPTLQKLQVATTSALNVFLLPVAIMSTLMDPIYVGVRSGNMNEAWSAYGEGLKSIADTFLSKGGKLNSEAAKFAEDVNLIAQAGMTEPIADLFNGVGVTGTIKKINKAFFRFNLMQGWEQAMFAASAMAAKRSILHHSTLPDPKWSKVFLEELGLKQEDIQTTDKGDLAVFEHDGLTPEQARKIQSAIHAFSFQAAARPSAMSNSIWMNDRYYALLAHMKPFTMAQAAGVLDWVEKRAHAQDYTPALRILPAVPVALAAEAAKSVLTGGTMANSPWEAFKKAYMQAGLEGRWIFADRLFSGLMNNQGVYAFTNMAPVTSVAGNMLRGG